MNIFYVHKDPVEAAKALCDKHIVKMPLESAQMLCVPLPNAPYRPTHVKHPCTLWASQSMENYTWLCMHGAALCHEYTARYGRVHACEEVIYWCLGGASEYTFPESGFTPPPLAMPDEFKCDDPVQSYRNYYLGAKADIAEWNYCSPPDWWNL